MTTPVYWVAGGTGNWSSTTNWSASSGGASGANVPTSAISAIFDGNSGAGTATVDGTSNALDVTFTGFTGTLAGSAQLNIYGSLVMAATVTNSYTGTLIFKSTSTGKTITNNGFVYTSTFTFSGVGGGWTLNDDLVTSGVRGLNIVDGTFNTNDKALTFDDFQGLGGIANLGASTLTLSGSGSIWGTGGTINAGTSTIKITNSTASNVIFAGAGGTYHNLYNHSSGSGVLQMTGSNTFNNIQIDPNLTQQFAAGSTTTLTSLTATGTAGNLVTLQSSTTSAFTLNFTGARQSNDYMSLSYSTATGAAAYAGLHSTNGGNNTGWIFSTPVNGSLLLGVG